MTTTTTTPRPGDVVRFVGGEYDGRLGVIDGAHFGMDMENGRGALALVVLGASAFYGDGGGLRGRTVNPEREYVSCSGGPCPFAPLADLCYAGNIVHTFWRWTDRPRGGGGENYHREVTLWEWHR